MHRKAIAYKSLAICVFASMCLTPIVLADSEQSERAGIYLGASSSSSLACITGSVPDPVRGLTVGCTFFEHQKHGSMNRQIATAEPGHVIQFTWTNQDNNQARGGRNIRWEVWDTFNGFLLDGTGGCDVGANLILPNRAGRVTLDAASDGLSIVALDWNRNFGTPGIEFQPFVFRMNFFCEPEGGTVDTTVWHPLLSGNATSFRYPKVAFTGTPTFTRHIVISSNRTDGDNLGIYTRKIGIGEWESPVILGLAGYQQSFVITASRQSDRVVIAWSGGRGDGTEFGASISRFNDELSGKNDNDIYVITSEDAGATWSSTRNVTQRANANPGGWAPHAKLSILFDETDSLHVVWQALEWVGYDAKFNTRSRMFHWGKNTNAVRTAVDANWDPTLCNGGENTLNLDNPQLSACNGNLYLSYTQFAPVPLGKGDDCSERAFSGDSVGAANGDIYVSVSSDGGFTWDAPRNLTNTYTPNCDTISGGANLDCDSDVWHSVIRYGIDMTGQDFDAIPNLTSNIDPSYAGPEFLVAQYINDSDPGAAIRGEGGWTDNDVYAFRFGCVEPVASAILASSLPEVSVFTVLETPLPTTDTTFDWILENIGSLSIPDLIVTLANQTPPGAFSLSGFPAALAAGGTNADTVQITLHASALPPGSGSVDFVVNGSFVGAPKTYSLKYTLTTCCNLAGDANNDGRVNISDVVFLIRRIFAGGPPAPCCEEADANGDGRVAIADLTFLIARIFAGGAPPVCGPVGMGC